MDLVKIGFIVKADGLKDANTQVDNLLDKVDSIGTKGKKSAAEFETGQKKVQRASKETEKVVVSASDKMIKKQEALTKFLPTMDKQTASLAASFSLVSNEANQLDKFLGLVGNNKALLQVKKDSEALTKAQEQNKKVVEATLGKYEQLSAKPLGMGILDSIERQDKGLQSLNKEYAALEKQQSKNISVVSQYEQASRKSFGGGVLDNIDKQNKGLDALNKQYRDMEAGQSKILSTEKKTNQERQKAITLEQTKSKYLNQGFTKSNSTNLARMEVSGADVGTLTKYKQALNETSRAMEGFSTPTKVAVESNNKLLASVKGIAQYAILSAAIYGVITAVGALGKSFVTMSDEYSSIQNRMKLYIKDTQELAKVNANLAQFSMANNIGLRETASLFTRLSPAMQKIGASTSATLAVVDAFGKSMRIGGATAMEAASATIQFSQAMASGKLSGDEFKSITEAGPRFLQAIADGAGIAASRLKEMSSAGMLTTEVIAKALLKEYPKLIEENKKLGVTLEQGANSLKTAFLVAIGEFNEGAGITQAIGSSMMDLAQSMIVAAQSAREFGQDVKKWFGDNATTINMVTEAVKLLAVALMSRYVAAVILARIESIRYQATLLTMAAAQTGVARSATVMSTAISAAGLAAKGALSFFGGWVGLALTVAGVAASYLLMSNSSKEVTKELALQGVAATKTKEELVALKGAQASLEKKGLSDEFAIQNAELKRLNTMIGNSVASISSQNTANFQASKILKDVRSGAISYSDALKQLNTMKGVNPEQIKTIQDLIVEYEKVKSSAIKNAESQKHLGVEVKVAGNALQNALPFVDAFGNSLSDTGDKAVIAGNKVADYVTKLQRATYQGQVALQIRKNFGLDQDLANQAAEISIGRREKGEGMGVPLDYLEALKQEQARRKQEDAYNESLKPPKKPKKSDINNFPDQLAQAERLVALGRQSVDLDVAKIASQKEYVRWYGSNLDMAKSLVTIDKQRAEIEKQRQEQEQKREAKKQGYKTVIDDLEAMKNKSKFIAEGFLPSVSEKSASLGFTPDVAGIQYAQKATTLELEKQVDAYRNSAIEKRNIFELTKSGKTVEEAQIDNLLYTNKHLLPEQITLLEQIKDLQKKDRRADTLQKVVNDSNTMLRQAAVYSSMQNNDLGDIANSYDMINKSEVEHLNSWKKIVENVKEYNEYLVTQKANPFGDFSNVDFDVFGDFGNPFQSALDGLNLMLGGVDSLKQKYTDMYASLDQQTKDAAGNKDALDKIELVRQATMSKEIVDQKKLKDDQISSALKATKTLFKEDSKAYKVVSGLEQAFQAKKIAFAIWEKRETLQKMALKAVEYAKDIGSFLVGVATKIAAQTGLNTVQGVGAVLSAAQQPGPLAFVGFAAMAALVAGLGIAVASGGSSGSFAPTNEGTGTVFGDSTAQSESIKKSIDLLADNSDVTLPLTSAMLKALQNIESNISGLANLLIRAGAGTSLASNVSEGFTQDKFGSLFEKAGNTWFTSAFGSGDFLGINKMIGSFLGGLFGTKTSIKGQGLFAGGQALSDILGNGFSLQEYVDINTKKKTLGVTTSNKNSTVYSQASEELSTQFTLIFKNFYDSILNTAPLLDKNLNEVTTKLNDFVVSIGKVNLQGLSGEQIQEKLNAILGAEADKMAQAAIGGLEGFQKIGEGYFETVMRVATSIELADVYTARLNVSTVKYTDLLNKQGDVATEIIRQSVLLAEGNKNIANGFYDLVNSFNGTAEEITDFVLTLRDLQDAIFATGKNGDYLTSAMFAGAGSLERLSSGLDAYFEMLSPAEQAAELTRRLTNQFAIFGKELPSNVKAFRDLVAGIDITTEAGQKLYGQIIATAPEFNDLQDAIADANSEVNALVQSLRDLAEQARAARGETEQPRNLAFIRSQFESNAILAAQGDTAAAEKLLTLGKDLMSLSKQYSLSSSEYARDLALIQRAATVSADVQEAGLGYTTPTLTPLVGTTGGTVVQTANAATDAKLEALRADMVIAITAVAKYTQQTADRLERWDFGDRMNVHIDQDVNDIPIPVTVVP